MKGVSLWAAILAMSCSPGLAADSKDAGKAAGNMVIQNYGSKQALNQNLSVPMTNGNTRLNTLDKSKSFNAALSTPSSDRFLQVLMQPGPTGDLATVIVAQDLTGSGSFTHSLQLDVPVSGVCANGFISCSPGTWNGCQPYAWSSDNTGKIGYSKVGITQLGGCYCINSSCASGGQSLAFANSPIILKDLGAGAVGAVHATDATVMITDVKTDMMTITYYGQLVKETKSATGQVQALQPLSLQTVAQNQAYYSNWSQLEADASNFPVTQGGDSTGMYAQLLGAANSNHATTRKCAVKRTGRLLATQKSLSNTGSTSFCVDHLSYVMMKKNGELNYTMLLAGAGPDGSIGKNCGTGWLPVAEVTLPDQSATTQWKLTSAVFSASLSGSGCNNGIVSLDALINGTNLAVQTPSSCGAGGTQTLTADWSYLFQYTHEEYQEGVDNQCAAYEADTTCRLQAEEVDTVPTWQNYIRTGLSPLANCHVFPSQIGEDMNVCRPWWDKKRTYICESKPFDFSAVKQRYKTVNSTTADNVSDVTYSDNSKDSAGNWVMGSGKILLPNRDAAPDCEQACKVKRPKMDTQVGTVGVISDNRLGGVNSLDTFYLTCSSGTCPVEAGDVVLTDCTCLNEFGQAATVMQMMRLSGSDSICSKGTPSPP